MRNIDTLYALLGWQGGTVHQVAAALNVNANELLHASPKETYLTNGSYMKGQYAHDTCSIGHQRAVLLPQYRGDLNFWLGYIRAGELKARQSKEA
jgi:hypothetical protein